MCMCMCMCVGTDACAGVGVDASVGGSMGASADYARVWAWVKGTWLACVGWVDDVHDERDEDAGGATATRGDGRVVGGSMEGRREPRPGRPGP